LAIELKNTVYRAGSRDATPLVLVHAFPVDHRMWDDCALWIARLADERGLPNFAIWAPEMPGAGDCAIPSAEETGTVNADGSYADALSRLTDSYVELVRRAGFSKAVFVGLSMGGYVAMDVVRRHPDILAGLALCDTQPGPDAPQARANRLKIATLCEQGNTLEPVMHFALPQPGDSAFKRSPACVALFTRWIHEQSPAGIAWRQRMAAGRPDLTGQLPGITVPAAVVCGALDPSLATMRGFVPLMTGTRVATTQIEDCGHFSAVEQPAAVARALVDLMQRVAQSPAAHDTAIAH
jgi:pimeloyl-ACP methyl ester carboxylesterase